MADIDIIKSSLVEPEDDIKHSSTEIVEIGKEIVGDSHILKNDKKEKIEKNGKVEKITEKMKLKELNILNRLKDKKAKEDRYYILMVTEKGYGKRIEMSEFKIQKKGE